MTPIVFDPKFIQTIHTLLILELVGVSLPPSFAALPFNLLEDGRVRRQNADTLEDL